MHKNIPYLFLGFFILIMISCKVNYSFSGADVDPNLKTVSISYFENLSGNGPANMSDLFTNALKEKILTETNLNLVNTNGDIEFKGSIVNYYYTVQAPTGNETSDKRRITMSVNVEFLNNTTDDKNEQWSQNFQNNSEHSVDVDLNSVEIESIEIINELMVEEIFTKAFVKW